METIQKIMYFVIGDRDTIKRGFACGLFTGIPMTLLIIIYFVLMQNRLSPTISYFENLNFMGWVGLYPIVLFSLVFGMIGSRALGWLLIRPIASILKELTDVDVPSTWAFSSIIVWIPIMVLITQPYKYQTGSSHWILFLVTCALTLVISFIGGKMGTQVPVSANSDSRDLIMTGGTITGSLFAGISAITGNISLSSIPASQSLNMMSFCFAITAFSLICMLPYILIVPLANAFTKKDVFSEYLPAVYSLTSAICWALIGIFLARPSINSGSIENLWMFMIMGLYGAAGGWAIDQLKRGQYIANDRISS